MAGLAALGTTCSPLGGLTMVAESPGRRRLLDLVLAGRQEVLRGSGRSRESG